MNNKLPVHPWNGFPGAQKVSGLGLYIAAILIISIGLSASLYAAPDHASCSDELSAFLRQADDVDTNYAVPLLVFQEQGCPSCNIPVVNSLSNQLVKHIPHSNIIAVVKDGTPKGLESIRKKYKVGSVLADTSAIMDRFLGDTRFTEMLIVGRCAKLLFRREEVHLRPVRVDTMQLIWNLSEASLHRDVVECRGIAAAIKHEGKVTRCLLSKEHSRFVIWNFDDNELWTYDIYTGDLLTKIEIPDKLRYYFGTSDKLLRGMKQMHKLGYDPAAIGGIALSSNGDTMFTLVNLLAEETRERIPNPDKKGDTIEIDMWHKRQVLAIWGKDSLYHIQLLPEHTHTFLSLIRLSTGWIGNALWKMYSPNEMGYRDSSRVFKYIRDEYASEKLLTTLEEIEKMTDTKYFIPTYHGRLVSIDSENFCYLNQANGVFIIGGMKSGNMRLQPVEAGGNLRTSLYRRNTPIDSANIFSQLEYFVSDMGSDGTHIHVLLTPSRIKSDRMIFQTYTNQGAFVSEQSFNTNGMNINGHIAGYHHGKAIILFGSADSGWAIKCIAHP